MQVLPMSDSPENKTATSSVSWKLAAAGSVVAVIATLLTLGDVPLIISGLIALTAVGWGFVARDNKRSLENRRG
jgi:hypothetical protein